MTLEECKRSIVEHIYRQYESRWPDRVPKSYLYLSLDFLSLNGGLPYDRELLIESSLSDLSSIIKFTVDKKGLFPRMKFFVSDDNLTRVYSYLGIQRPEERISLLFDEIQRLDIKSQKLLFALSDRSWICENLPLNDAVCTISLLKLLDFCLTNTSDIHYRKLSAIVLGDSKAYERMGLDIKLAKLLRPFSNLDCSDSELLNVYGICKTPEIFELTGNFEIVKKDGSVCDYSFFKRAGLLSSEVLDDISCFITHAKSVVFYENIASYHEALKKRKEDEIIVFESGFFGPGRKRLFELLYQADTKIKFFHSGDIDAGGFDETSSAHSIHN